MKRIISKLTFCIIAKLLCAAALTTVILLQTQNVSAQRACSQWDMTGEWKFVQTNGTSPTFILKSTPTGLQGTASYYRPYRGYEILVKASVDGVLNGDTLEITAYWNNGVTGVYKGKIGPQGRIEGSTYDKQDPQTRADWYSDRTATCASQAACSKWDMSGSWTFVQTNDTAPIFTLEQTRTGLKGTAIHHYIHKDECKFPLVSCGDDYYKHTATVNGAVNGNSIEITAYWSNNTIGLYTGTIGPQGRIEGETYNKEQPQTKARWYSDRTLKCLVGTAEPGGSLGTSSSALSIPPPQFIGTFGTTPSNYQPMWVYAIRYDGDLVWYRKDTGTSSWQGPKRVGKGWNFKDVIPAGGNSLYTLTEDGKLFWYHHMGFNDGTLNWKGAVEVGRGWGFAKIFSGGEGIIYAITHDGKLRWYKHNGYLTGAGLETPGAWEGAQEVGRGWGIFDEVFSAGGGVIYAITKDGKLRWYKHNGYLSGAGSETPGAWEGPKEVGHGWNGFRQIVPAGAGVILGIQNDGKLRWYKHNGYLSGTGLETPGAWEGPVEVGTSWHGFKKVIALLPVTSAPVVR